MARYETSVASPWPVQRAFHYLADLEHFAEWDPGVIRAERVAGEEPGPGAAFDVTVKSVGRHMVLRYEITTYAPPHRVEVLAQTSALRSFDVMTFEDRGDDGCVVTYVAELDFRGARALANPLLGVAFKKIGDRAADGLRRVLQGSHV